MCEIITIGGRLAHASSLTYRFWGDASREESLFGVTPRARRHPKKCEASPQRLRGVTPKMEGWPLTSFSKIIFFQKQTSHCASRSYGALPSLKNRRFQHFLFLSYCKCGENARSHPDRRYNKKHCIRNYLEYLVNIWYVSATWPPVKKKGNVPRKICHK